MMFRGLFLKFGNQENIEKLYKQGLIYCNTFEYFQKCDNKEQHDPYENASEVLKGKNCKLVIDGKEFEIDPESSIGIYKGNDPNCDYTNIFCTAAFSYDGKLVHDNNVYDPSLFDFGDTLLVIYDVEMFISRITKKLEDLKSNNIIENYMANLVEYVDMVSYEGSWGAFKKSDKYKHQMEWRLAIKIPQQKEPFTFDIGNIEDISKISPRQNCVNKVIQNPSGTYNLEI